MKMVRPSIGSEMAESKIRKALFQCDDSPDAAMRYSLDKPDFVLPPLTVKKTVTSTGASRVSMLIDQENQHESDGSGFLNGGKVEEEVDEGELGSGIEIEMKVKENQEGPGFLEGVKTEGNVKSEVVDEDVGKENQEGSGFFDGVVTVGKVKEESEEYMSVKENKVTDARKMSFEEWLQLPENSHYFKKENPQEENVKKESIKQEVTVMDNEAKTIVKMEVDEVKATVEQTMSKKMENEEKTIVIKKVEEVISVQPLRSVPMSYNPLPQKERVEDRRIRSTVVLEDGDFLEEPDWLLVGRNLVMGLSTTKGRKLENNEIVHFAFPNVDSRNKYNSPFVSSKAAFAASGIVRFSTKRYGEVIILSSFLLNLHI